MPLNLYSAKVDYVPHLTNMQICIPIKSKSNHACYPKNK